MHTRLIEKNTLKEVHDEIEKIQQNLNSCTPAERDWTVIKDIKLCCSEGKYAAILIFCDQRY